MDVQQILNEEMQVLEADIILRHEQAGQVASGKTKASFELKISPFTGQLLGANYVGVLERGRKPGGLPKDFIDILQRWATAKGISFSDEKQFNRWANAVKWKIIREGSKLYRSGQKQDIFETPIANFQDRFSNRIVNYYQNEIANEIFKF